MQTFTRMDSPVVPKVTAHRDAAASKECSVTRLPDSSGRETKPSSTADCPTENTSTPAAGAGEVAKEGEGKDDEGCLSEASRRGERSREDFFSSTRADAAASPGTNAGACGDIWVDIAAAAMTTSCELTPSFFSFFFLCRFFLDAGAASPEAAGAVAGNGAS